MRPRSYLYPQLAAILLFSVLCTEIGDTWVVIVCTSRYWFNYRHLANALAIYKEVRAQGISDERILLMSALEAAMDPRNPFPGEIYSTNSAKNMINARKIARNNANFQKNSSIIDGDVVNDLGLHSFHMPGDVIVDYSGNDCNVDAFLRLLTGRHPYGTALSQQLRSGPNSRVLLYMTGHGGNEFLKFHDKEEMSAADLAISLRQMWLQRRYKELLLIVDTCQASTLGAHLDSVPAITFISSSALGENSFAYDTNHELGLAVVDRFTYKLQNFMEKSRQSSVQRRGIRAAPVAASVHELVQFMRQPTQRAFLHSTVGVQQSTGARALTRMNLADFFGAAAADENVPPTPAYDGSECSLKEKTMSKQYCGSAECSHALPTNRFGEYSSSFDSYVSGNLLAL